VTTDAHQRFHEWLTAGAEGEPPRDLAIHASVCAGCHESIAAFDRLAAIDPGRAAMPGGAATGPATGPAKLAPVLPAPATTAPTTQPVAAHIRPMPTRVTTLTASNLAARIGAAHIAEAPVAAPPVKPPPPPVAAGGDQGGGRRRSRVAVLLAATVFGALILGVGATQLISAFRGGGQVAQATPTPSQSELFTNTPQPSGSFTPPESTSPMESVTAAPTPVATAIPTPIPTPKPTAPPKPGSPGAPTGLTAVATIGHITLHWSAPASNGGSPITRYDIYRDGSNTKLYSTTSPTLTEGVGNGDTHVYRVTAVNKVGAGPYSNPASATTPNVPGAPGSLSATGEIGLIALSWSAPASNGSPITRYDIFIDGAGSPVQVTSLGYTDVVPADGSHHTYVVKAVNAVGSSSPAFASADEATPTPPPPTPTPSPTETPSPPPPQCSDGIDNDGDGYIDYPADPGCTDSNDDDELPINP
jgi:hypothetical protein